MLDNVKEMASQYLSKPVAAETHPLDPLSAAEIEKAVAIVSKAHAGLHFNAVTLWEPRKLEMMAWLQDPETTQKPHRVADIVAIGRGSKVYDGLVDLDDGKITRWELTTGVQPLVRDPQTFSCATPDQIRSLWRT